MRLSWSLVPKFTALDWELEEEGGGKGREKKREAQSRGTVEA